MVFTRSVPIFVGPRAWAESEKLTDILEASVRVRRGGSVAALRVTEAEVRASAQDCVVCMIGINKPP